MVFIPTRSGGDNTRIKPRGPGLIPTTLVGFTTLIVRTSCLPALGVITDQSNKVSSDRLYKITAIGRKSEASGFSCVHARSSSPLFHVIIIIEHTYQNVAGQARTL